MMAADEFESHFKNVDTNQAKIISEMNRHKEEVGKLGEGISSELETIGRLAKDADSECAMHLSKKLVSYANTEAAQTVHRFFLDFKIIEGEETLALGADTRFLELLRLVSQRNSMIRNRDFLDSVQGDDDVTRLELHKGLGDAYDNIINLAAPKYEPSGKFDGEYYEGSLEYQIGANAPALKIALDSLPANPPRQFKAILKDIIEVNWDFSIGVSSTQGMRHALEAYAKHYGKEQDVKYFFKGLHAECMGLGIAMVKLGEDNNGMSWHENYCPKADAKEYLRMARTIREIVAQYMPELLKEAKAAAKPTNKEVTFGERIPSQRVQLKN